MRPRNAARLGKRETPGLELLTSNRVGKIDRFTVDALVNMLAHAGVKERLGIGGPASAVVEEAGSLVG